MITEKTTIKTESIYSDDNKKRYSLSIEWDKQKPKALVIMVAAGTTNGVAFDHSTNYVLENLVTLDYGAVKITNLFSTIGHGRAVIDKDEDEENIKHIIHAAANADVIIYAVGTGHVTNKSFRKRQKELLTQLLSYEDKLMCISDVGGKKFYHPLCPTVRKWNLVPFKVSELITDDVKNDVKDDVKGDTTGDVENDI